MVKHSLHLRTYDRINSIEGTYQQYVIRRNLGHSHLQLVIGVVLVKHIFRIVALVKKRQGQRRLDTLEHAHAAAIDAVLLQKRHYHLSDAVGTCLTNKDSRHTDASKRHQRIICAAARNSIHRMIVAEDYVENGLANTNNFPHKIVFQKAKIRKNMLRAKKKSLFFS